MEKESKANLWVIKTGSIEELYGRRLSLDLIGILPQGRIKSVRSNSRRSMTIVKKRQVGA